MAERKSDRQKAEINYKVMNEFGKSEAIPPEEPRKNECKLPSDSDEDYCAKPEVNKQLMRKELEMLERKERLLEEEKEIRLLERRIKEKRDRIAELEKEGNCNESQLKRKDRKKKEGNIIDINSLRKDGRLRKSAARELKKLGLLRDSDSSDELSESSITDSSSTSTDSDSDISDSECRSKSTRKKKVKKSKKSGIKAKSSDVVKKRQKYPHSQLRFDFVNQNIEFNKLDINLFVAGELEIISSSKTSKVEKDGRLNLLKRLMYLNSTYEFASIRTLYAAIVREIELGNKKWSDDMQFVENAVLARCKPKIKNTEGFTGSKHKTGLTSMSDSSEPDKLWFCSKFQRNKCQNNANHMMVYKGKMRFAKHICATCWQKDQKELAHPECSTACPHLSA
ncbi:hypothetical protein ACF0H5_012736 [Mactra antiquata]